MKFEYAALFGALVAPLFAVSQPALANIYITFDYRYDSSDFFTGENSSRQNLLNAAASVFETRFQDNLTAISSSGSNRFDARFFSRIPVSTRRLSNYSVAPIRSWFLLAAIIWAARWHRWPRWSSRQRSVGLP